MSQVIDRYLLEKMEYEDDNELIISCIDDDDEFIDQMMEESSRMENVDRIFPVSERYQPEIDYDIQLIGEGLGVTTCKCGAVIAEGEKECKACKAKHKKEEKERLGVMK